MIAALKGHKLILSILSKITNNINFQDKEGNTVLHYAIVKENIGIFEILLENENINISIRNKEGNQCIDIAHPRIYVKVKNLLNRLEKRNQIGKFDVLISRKVSQNNLDNKMKDLIDKSSRPRNIISMKSSNNSRLTNPNIHSFVIHSIIGKGSFGEVYLVEKKDNNCFYAMKVLEKEKIMKDNLKRYALTERKVLSAINHPFIVKLRYAFQNNEFLFLIMDYHPGGDLGQYLEQDGCFDEERSKIYISEIILAIEELHRNNIIFRDLKPENIVLDNQGHALLIDFGLSKLNVKMINKGAKSFCGSIAYLAPEMVKKKGHGKAIDWYLIGVLLYEMLVGIPPYYDDSKEKLFDNIKNGVLEFPDFLSSNLVNLLKRLLERDPKKRIGSKNGSSDVKSHVWFSDINWKNVIRKKLKPPKPSITRLNLFEINNPPKFTQNKHKKYCSVNGWTFIDNSNNHNKS